MAEEIIMVPIPWRHVEDRIMDYLNDEYPQLKDKITSVTFTKDGIVVKYMKVSINVYLEECKYL